jgi:hypothetical protein
MAVHIKMTVFWDAVLCKALMMEAGGTSEMLVHFYQTAWHNRTACNVD